MGAGKSTVGQRLAEKLGAQFFDSDKVIEQRTGVDIPTVFEYEGEDGFRSREAKVLHELCQFKNMVLATGGGAVLSKNVRNLLSAKGTVFYLKASIDTLFNRTRGSTKRPLLETSNKRQKITALARQRESFYQEVANHVITTDHHTLDEIVNQILKHIENR